MIFGKNRDKGLMLDREHLKLKVVTIGENGITENDILVHNEKSLDNGIHTMLVSMKSPEMPIALGVIRNVADATYDDNVRDQQIDVNNKSSIHCMDELLRSGATWEVN